MLRSKPITGELLALKNEMREYAVGYGLDFFEVIFEECDYDTVNILAAQGGFPTRYPHWRFGMDYDQLSQSYRYGLSKIYEMVINTNPCYAYLLVGNHWVDQKIVMAHVYGHSDFFKNNLWFKNTDRNMMDVMANHATKIRRYMEKYGVDEVENFIDVALSLENMLDVNNLFLSPDKRSKKEINKDDDHESIDNRSAALKSYMRSVERSKDKGEQKKLVKKAPPVATHKLPERDIMKFLMENAPLFEWQADILAILREEAYYFLPQRMTKIMNEGWASYWHAKIMTQKAVKANELIDFADHHAGVLAMSRKQINPYKVGIELMRDIEYRWDRGMHGKEFNECQDMNAKNNWDTNARGKGREKIFEVRRTHNDITFIDEFLTPEFCERMQLFTHKYNPRTGRKEIDSRDFEAIKKNLLSGLTNFGSPLIDVVDANFNNRGELQLMHVHNGVDLDLNYAQATMKNIYTLWQRPVNLTTHYQDKEVTFCYNGTELKPLK